MKCDKDCDCKKVLGVPIYAGAPSLKVSIPSEFCPSVTKKTDSEGLHSILYDPSLQSSLHQLQTQKDQELHLKEFENDLDISLHNKRVSLNTKQNSSEVPPERLMNPALEVHQPSEGNDKAVKCSQNEETIENSNRNSLMEGDQRASASVHKGYPYGFDNTNRSMPSLKEPHINVHDDALPEGQLDSGGPVLSSPISFPSEITHSCEKVSLEGPSSKSFLLKSQAIGGHHVTISVGKIFMKQSTSRREESFYFLIEPFQEALVDQARGNQRPHTENGNISKKQISAHTEASSSDLEDAGLVTRWWNLKVDQEKRHTDATVWAQRGHHKIPHSEVCAPIHDFSHESNDPMLSSDATSVAKGENTDSDSKTDSKLSQERLYEEERNRDLQYIAPFVPLFYGLRYISAQDVVVLSPCHAVLKKPLSADQIIKQTIDTFPYNGIVDCSHSQGSFSPSGTKNSDEEGSWRMIALEDVCHGFSYPCVLDMKMGSRQYGLHPSPEKKIKKETRSAITTSKMYGVRLAGYRRCSPETNSIETATKIQCRHLSFVQVQERLWNFLQNSKKLANAFYQEVTELRAAFSQQRSFRFFTSSLLFVYDAAQPVQTCRVVMVDFAFTYDRKELKEGGDEYAEYDYDVGYIKALDTLLSLLS